MLKPTKFLITLISTFTGLTLIASLFLQVSIASALGATSTDMPLYFLRSADCTGEVVEISGTLHMLNQIQADGSVMGHFNYFNVSGVGLTSGNTYAYHITISENGQMTAFIEDLDMHCT